MVVFGKDELSGQHKVKVPTFERLDYHSWTEWRHAMATYAKFQLKIDLTDGSFEACQAKGWLNNKGQLDNKATVDWTQGTDEALAQVIMGYVAQPVRDFLARDGSTGSGIKYWCALVGHFHTEAARSAVALARTAMQIKFDGEGLDKEKSSTEHKRVLGDLDKINNKLVLPKDVAPKDLIMVIALINAHPGDHPAFSTYLQQILQGDVQMPTYAVAAATLTGKFQAYLDITERNDDTHGKYGMALISKGQNAARNGGAGRGRGRGRGNGAERGGAPGSSDRTCFTCGSPDHMARDCPDGYHQKQKDKQRKGDKSEGSKSEKKNEFSDSLYTVQQLAMLAGRTPDLVLLAREHPLGALDVFDSGATGCLVRSLEDLEQVHHLPHSEQLHFTGGNKGSDIIGRALGVYRCLLCTTDGEMIEVRMQAVWVPVLPTRALVGKEPMAAAGGHVLADGQGGPWHLSFDNGRHRVLLREDGGLLTLPRADAAEGDTVQHYTALSVLDRTTFHRRLGHTVKGTLLDKTARSLGVTLTGEEAECLRCDTAKARRANVPRGAAPDAGCGAQPVRRGRPRGKEAAGVARL